MKTEQNNLDRLKGKNPFTVPEGYMEGLTANIMSQLPEREPEEEVKKVSLMDRVRPWLYMAAVFAGLGLFFKVLVGSEDKAAKTDSLLVKQKCLQPQFLLCKRPRMKNTWSTWKSNMPVIYWQKK